MTQPHDDPVDEAKRDLLQSLSVLSTLGEAAARYAAVGIQRKAAEEEKAAGRLRAAAAAQQEADRLAAQAREERQKLAEQLDGSWIEKATFDEAAATWRTATVHAAAGDPVAQKVAGLALDRLGQLNPQWRQAYDRARAAGRSAPDAARMAAYEVWETEARARGTGFQARAHGGPDRSRTAVRRGANGRALPAGGQVLDDLDAAVRAEAARLVQYISPEALDRLQRTWRAAGMAPAADGIGLARQAADEMVKAGLLPPAVGNAIAEHLDAHAERERAAARTAAGMVDDPRTVVDEHTAGQVTSRRRHGAADHDTATAADQRRRWGNTFPPLMVSGKLPPEVARKQPAQVVARQTRGVSR